MTAGQVPWTRAERTREIGYAQAMFEMSRFARELKESFRPGPIPESALPPEVAYALGVGTPDGLTVGHVKVYIEAIPRGGR